MVDRSTHKDRCRPADLYPCPALVFEELAVKIVDVRERDEHGACAALKIECSSGRDIAAGSAG